TSWITCSWARRRSARVMMELLTRATISSTTVSLLARAGAVAVAVCVAGAAGAWLVVWAAAGSKEAKTTIGIKELFMGILGRSPGAAHICDSPILLLPLQRVG